MALGVPLGSAFGSIAMDTSALVAAARTASSSFGQIGRGAEAARVTIVRTQQQAAAAMDRVRGSLNIQQRAYQILEQEVVAVGQQFGATSIQAQKKQLALDKLSQSVANNQQRMAALDAELREANARLASVGSGAGQAVSRFEQLRGQLERTRATMERVGESMMKTGGILSAGITAPLGAVAALGLSFDAMGEQAHVAFTKMLGSGAQATAFLNQLKDFAASTPFEFPELQESAKKLLAMGFNAKDVVPMLTDVGDAVAGVGGSSEVLDGVILALGQMQAKGKVSAEEMNQFAERGIPAWRYLAEAIGTDIPTAMKRAEKGAIDADTAIAAIRAGMRDDFGGMMAEQSQTMLGVLSTIKDVGVQIAGEAMLPAFVAIRDGLRGVADALPKLQEAFRAIPESVRTFVVVFAAAAAAVGPLALGVGGLMTAAAAVSAPLILATGAIAGLAGALASGNPVVIGATVAIAAYMVAQQWGAVVASVSAIAAQTAALAANAVAAAAAAGPFLVLGAVVAGGIAIYQKWSHIADEAAQKWLDQSASYQGAAQALDRYNEASTEAQAAAAGQATELRKLQDAQAKDIALRAEAAKQGDRDQAWWEANAKAITERSERMQALTGEITTLMDAEEAATAMTEEQVVAQQASARATAEAAAATKFAAGDIGGALAELRASANLTEEQMDALGKAITDAAKEGAQAFGAAVGTEVGFLSDREAAQQGHGEKLTKITDSYNADLADLNTRYAQATTDAERAKLAGQIADLKQNHTDRLAEEDTAFQASELKAAEAYAREQAAQLAHLGQMLIDYTTAQATMAGMSDAQIQEMTSKLADQYGVQASLVDRSFSEMTGSIDTWVASGGQNTDAYLANMQRIQAETVTTQQQVDAKIGEMTAQAKADFDAGKLTVEQYAAKLTTIPAAAQRVVDALNGIPTSINSTVTITTVEKTVREGTGGRGDASTRTATTGSPGASGTRALGGPVRPRSLYEVTEGGIPELLAMAGRTYLLTGGQGGQVIPAMRAAQASLAGQGAAMRQKSKDAEDVAGDAYNRLYADPRFRDTIAKAGSEGLIAFRRMWERGDFKGGDFGVQEDDPLIDAIFDARRAAAQGSAPSVQASLTTAMRALAGQGAAMRQAAAAPLGGGGAMRQAAAAPLGGGGAMRPAAGAVINLTVAPVFQGAIIDTAERVQAVAQEIVATARTVIGGDLRAAVDQLIQSGGSA